MALAALPTLQQRSATSHRNAGSSFCAIPRQTAMLCEPIQISCLLLQERPFLTRIRRMQLALYV